MNEQSEKLMDAITLKVKKELKKRMSRAGIAGSSGAEWLRKAIEREVIKREKKRLSGV